MDLPMQWCIYFAILLFVPDAIATLMTFNQSDYILTYERAEVVSCHPDYISNLVITNWKYNRTQTVNNVTIALKKNMSANVKIQIQAYKFMSNEYRYFPILFSYNFCEGMRSDDFGMGRFYECGNLTKRCPFIKGNYFMCNFAPNGEKYPPHIPEGSYMLDVKWFDDLTEFVFVRGYGKVKTKNKWEMH